MESYLYPRELTLTPFEEAWDGFKFVHVVSTPDDLKTVCSWYEHTFPEALSTEEDDYTIFTFDAGDLHLAPAADTEGLQAFFGSSVLADLAARQTTGTIGVLRFHDYYWDMPPVGASEGKVWAVE